MKKVFIVFLFLTIMGSIMGNVDAAEKPKVYFKTNIGDFTIELEPELAPKTVANFIQYVEEGHYDGLIFHRVIKAFMIQGG